MTLVRELILPPLHRRPGPQATVIAALRIEAEDDGFYLFRCDEAGAVVADTWHEDMKAAMEQAESEFGVRPSDWTTAE